MGAVPLAISLFAAGFCLYMAGVSRDFGNKRGRAICLACFAINAACGAINAAVLVFRSRH